MARRYAAARNFKLDSHGGWRWRVRAAPGLMAYRVAGRRRLTTSPFSEADWQDLGQVRRHRDGEAKGWYWRYDLGLGKPKCPWSTEPVPLMRTAVGLVLYVAAPMLEPAE